MKKAGRYLALILILCMVCCMTACGRKKSEVIDFLEGTYVIDFDAYARAENVDKEDLRDCKSEWRFTKDGQVTVSLTTKLSAKEASDALKKETVSENTVDYSLSEKIECTLSESDTYQVTETQILGAHNVVMGEIKSNKTDKKGVTTIKLDTPNGSTKTLKGTLNEDGTQFTINNNENKMSATYTLREGKLVADKGVILGTIRDRNISDTKITLTVAAPDGETLTYTGNYLSEMKLGGAVFSYEYADSTLYLKNSAHSLVLKKK